MRTHLNETGFIPPSTHPLGRERRVTALAELLAILGLTLSIIVTVTVVSTGIARADVIGGVEHGGTLFAVALLLGLIFIGVASFSERGGETEKS